LSRKMRLLSASLGKHKEPICQLAPRAGARREPSHSGPLRDGPGQGEVRLEVGMHDQGLFARLLLLPWISFAWREAELERFFSVTLKQLV